MQMQMNLILIDGAVELRIEDHRCRACDVILTRIVVVALIVGIVIMGGHRDRCRRARCPGTVMVTRTARIARTTAGEDVRVAGPGGHQRQGGGRRSAVSRVHGHAIRRVGVLLILRGEHCKRKTKSLRFPYSSFEKIIYCKDENLYSEQQITRM